MALKLENKVAWVSGANKGIGAGIALSLIHISCKSG